MYVIDTTAILSIFFNGGDADQVLNLLRRLDGEPEKRVLVPFSVMAELEAYLALRLPGQMEQVMALVMSWPIEIVESFPRWRHQAAQLRAVQSVPWSIAWVAALAQLQDAKLVYLDPAYQGIPGIKGKKIG